MTTTALAAREALRRLETERATVPIYVLAVLLAAAATATQEPST